MLRRNKKQRVGQGGLDGRASGQLKLYIRESGKASLRKGYLSKGVKEGRCL